MRRGLTIRIHVSRSRHIIHVELSRLLQLYSYLESEAKWFLGRLIHRRGIEEDSTPGRQDMARWERLPSQSMERYIPPSFVKEDSALGDLVLQDEWALAA
jgi:hypothetical protein